MDQSATIRWRQEHGVAAKTEAALIYSVAPTALTKLRAIMQSEGVNYAEHGPHSVLISAETNLLSGAVQRWRDTLDSEEVLEIRATLFESKAPSAQDLARAPLRLTDLDVAIALMDTRWLVQLLATESHFMVFQPIVSLATRKVAAYECLLRGRRNGAVIGAAPMFAAAQALGITRHLEHSAWQKAIELGQELARSGHMLFLNFSPNASADRTFAVDRTQKICAQHNVDIKQIVLEITESEKDYDPEPMRVMMQEYRAAGAKFALDDLGSGHSSILRLAVIRPDFVKLDQGLVRGAHAEQGQAVFMKAISEAAHQLEIPVIAEGVETAEDLKHCIDIGADLVQGYFLARPSEVAPQLSAEAILLLEQWSSKNT